MINLRLLAGKRIQDDKCVICGGHKSRRFWVCKRCSDEFNLEKLTYKQWPPWLKALVNIERRRLYRQHVMEEIPMDPDSIALLIEGDSIYMNGMFILRSFSDKNYSIYD